MRQITIIGAGLVGSLWAYLLKKQNYDVTVFEKRQNPKDLHMQAGRSIVSSANKPRVIQLIQPQ